MKNTTPVKKNLHSITHNVSSEYSEERPDLEKVRKLQVFRKRYEKMSNDQLLDALLAWDLWWETKEENEEIKSELRELFSDEKNITELRKLLQENSEDVQNLLHGYKKLAVIKNNDKKIAELESQNREIKLNLFANGKTLETATTRTQQKYNENKAKIKKLQHENQKLLNTKEIVAAYELDKLAYYSVPLRNKKRVYTPSVKKYQQEVSDLMLDRKNVLLSGPVGTWKTKMARKTYREMLDAKFQAGTISQEDYETMKANPIVNGNEESTLRDINSKPLQLSNKAEDWKSIQYGTWILTRCMKNGLPLIIDEANRVPSNFLSGLKCYLSMENWDTYEDTITQERLEVQWPLQQIMTANEWSRYSQDVNRFQDQITREFKRIYIWYFPKAELYDVFKAKLYEHPGFAYVTKYDLTDNLKNLVDAIDETNQLYLSGKEYTTSWNINGMRIRSTVIDTQRALELVQRSKIWSKETFWQEINENIVNFIKWIAPDCDDDRKILCSIFHAKWLLCKENIPELLKWSDKLEKSDLEPLITTPQKSVDKNHGERITMPRIFATTQPYARYNGKTFDELGRDNVETQIRAVAKDIVELNVFNPLNDGQICEILQDCRNKSDLQKVLSELVKKAESESDKITEIVEILESAEKINSSLVPADWREGVEKLRVPESYEKISTSGWSGSGSIEERLSEVLSGLPNEIQKFQQARESTIDLDEATKKEMIALRDKLLQDGTLTYQNHPEWWIITTFNGLSWVENPRFYDATKILKPAFEKDGILEENEYTFYWQKLSIRAKLKWLRWDIDKWSAKNTANAIKEQWTKYWLKMHSEEDMKTLFEKINTKNRSWWNENKNIAFWSLCTGCKWWYRLSNYSGSSRSSLISHDLSRYFGQHDSDDNSAGILL